MLSKLEIGARKDRNIFRMYENSIEIKFQLNKKKKAVRVTA